MKEFDYKKLKNRIRDYFDSQERFAKELHISSTALNYKLNGKINFSYNDLFIMIDLLEVRPEEIKDLFFTLKG